MIQSRVDSTTVPADIGRIPHKIMSGFASLTADQFKNWVVYYSIIAHHGILTHDNLECWRHFVLACRILCSNQLKQDQIIIGDALLLQFCKRTQRLYGPQSVTPNMHMHCHIRDCILKLIMVPFMVFGCIPLRDTMDCLESFQITIVL